MNLKQLITPKNDDGSIDHRYVTIAQSIVDLAGERVETQLRKLFIGTHNLESESASAGLQLVIALFRVPMDERYERSKLKKHIREQLQEIGFKPSKVSKLMGAGEFYARNYGHSFINDSFGEYFTESELVERQNWFLGEYFKSVSKLYELSRMTDMAVDRVRREFLNDNKIYSQAELEKLRQSKPRDDHERRGRKTNRANFPETRTAHALAMHESLIVMYDADDEPLVKQPESCQRLVEQFFQLFASGEMDRCLTAFAPGAQAQLINEIQACIPLLQEFVTKNKTIDVVPIH